MDLYTMNENFIAQDVVDDFVSAIWTERYFAAGDVQLVVPASAAMIQRLKEGTFIGLRGSKEVMQIETQSIENKLLTASGRSLVSFLDQRQVWYTDYRVSGSLTGKKKTDFPGKVIADTVSEMVINTTPLSYAADLNLEWELEEIDGLVLGPVDTSGTAELVEIAQGPLYEGIRAVAEKHSVGISLYLHSVSLTEGFVLHFTTYRGKDRTSGQEVNQLVRLSPALDSLTDLKELYSIVAYKNVVYVNFDDDISVHYEDPNAVPEGLNRRVLYVKAEGAPTPEDPARTYYTAEEEIAFREKVARDALANNNYIRAIDGQTSPDNEYKFGVDYFLGDLIELESFNGTITKARITEYIRAQDKIGTREYPTISVVP